MALDIMCAARSLSLSLSSLAGGRGAEGRRRRAKRGVLAGGRRRREGGWERGAEREGGGGGGKGPGVTRGAGPGSVARTPKHIQTRIESKRRLLETIHGHLLSGDVSKKRMAEIQSMTLSGCIAFRPTSEPTHIRKQIANGLAIALFLNMPLCSKTMF